MSAEPPPTEPEQPLAGPPPPESQPVDEPTKQRFRYVRLAPHRGSSIVGLGVSGLALAIFGSMMGLLSMFLCCPCPFWMLPLASLALSIPAWVMGHADLAAMDHQRMDPAGRDATKMGMICGIAGVAVIGLAATAIIMLVAIYAISAAASSSGL